MSFYTRWLCGRDREMFYLPMHSTHFIYGYMASDIWLRTILIVRKYTRCHHIGYSYRLTARVPLYAPSHRQDNTYHGLCYISRGALAGMRNSSMGPPHEGSIRWSIAPWANTLTTELYIAPLSYILTVWCQYLFQKKACKYRGGVCHLPLATAPPPTPSLQFLCHWLLNCPHVIKYTLKIYVLAWTFNT